MMLKFWYSETHRDKLPSRIRTVSILGERIEYTAASHPDADEPFREGKIRFPDYRPVGLSLIENLRVL
jgi:hypothetical protein